MSVHCKLPAILSVCDRPWRGASASPLVVTTSARAPLARVIWMAVSARNVSSLDIFFVLVLLVVPFVTCDFMYVVVVSVAAD